MLYYDTNGETENGSTVFDFLAIFSKFLLSYDRNMRDFYGLILERVVGTNGRYQGCGTFEVKGFGIPVDAVSRHIYSAGLQQRFELTEYVERNPKGFCVIRIV